MRLLLLLAPLAIALQGCAYHRLVVQRPNPADQTYHVVNSSALGWNASEQQSVADRCPTSLLSEVRVRTSFWQSLATVLTLGAWQPARMEYRCSKEPTGVGEIANGHSASPPDEDDTTIPPSPPRPPKR